MNIGVEISLCPAVTAEIRRSFEENALCVFAMKVLGPFTPGNH
jgi:hypothetical protein